MSGCEGRVGPWKLGWKSVPRGPRGSAYVEVTHDSRPDHRRQVEVHWRLDESGIWLELPDGVYGFDVHGTSGAADDGGRAYRVTQRVQGREWESLAFLRAGELNAAATDAAKKKGARVRAQMPGKVIRVLVAAGAHVEKDQPLMVLEAMKMENEIRAAQPGRVGRIHVSEGQAVESGADLLVIE
jgi:biotin carboxyl carrier protein